MLTGQVVVRAVRDDLELGDDPGQALRDGVVDLGGKTPALVGDPGLAGLDEELGVQCGVLVEGVVQRLVGAFQFGDGGGLGAGPLLVLGVEVDHHADQRHVHREQRAEQRPGSPLPGGSPPAWAPARITAVPARPGLTRRGTRSRVAPK